MLGAGIERLRVDGYVICPRCRVPMYYGSERVKDSSGVTVTRFYQCPACRSKLVDEKMVVKLAGDTAVVEVKRRPLGPLNHVKHRRPR